MRIQVKISPICRETTIVVSFLYSLHPELQEIDDTLRAQMPIGKHGDRFYDSLKTPTVDAAFQFLDSIKPLVEGPMASKIPTPATAEDFTAHMKSIAELYGASVTGVAKSDESFYYSHRGRTDQVYGDSVSIDTWPHTIVFAVPMNEVMIRMAPKAEESIAVTHGYVQAAIVGMILTYTIKAFGYEARNHMDGNYLCTLPLCCKGCRIYKSTAGKRSAIFKVHCADLLDMPKMR